MWIVLLAGGRDFVVLYEYTTDFRLRKAGEEEVYRSYLDAGKSGSGKKKCSCARVKKGRL
jgi:hypothetical protein